MSMRISHTGALQLAVQTGASTNWITATQWTNEVPLLHSWIRLTNPPADFAKGPKSAIDLGRLELLTGRLGVLVTNVLQLAQWQTTGILRPLVLELQGEILAESPNGEFLALQDSTAAVLLDLGSHRHAYRPGQLIRLQGNAVIEHGRIILRAPPLVDNDGAHEAAQVSATVHLTAGKHPYRLTWFNATNPRILQAFFAGPGLPRQPIPDAALFIQTANTASGEATWINGVHYRCAEGHWWRMPDYNHLLIASEGNTSNFNLEVTPQPEDISVEFSGSISVPREGFYTFTTISDDGSQFFINDQPPQIETGGTTPLPAPRSLVVGQPLRLEDQYQWVTVEGNVTFADQLADSLVLNLNTGGGSLRVDIADGQGLCATLLNHAHIQVTGIVQPVHSPSSLDTIVAGALLIPGFQQIQLLDLPEARWDGTPLISVSDYLATNSFWSKQNVVHLAGHLRATGSSHAWVLKDNTGVVPVELSLSREAKRDGPVEILGCRTGSETNPALLVSFVRSAPDPNGAAKPLPCLTTADQIKRLTREEAQLGYPVKLRGVVTGMFDTSLFLHDATGGIYARTKESVFYNHMRIGDYWEIEGVTFAEFAPNVRIDHLRFIGRGNLPAPLHPGWDRLINGSLDAEYVEIQGVVTDIKTNLLTLFTTGGRLQLQMVDGQPALLKQYANALVRIRGCVTSGKDPQTLQIEFGQIGIVSGSITMDQAAPANLFATPMKHASELRFFDYQAGSFQRVRIAGQIIERRQGMFFLLDNISSLRFVANGATNIDAGDVVEVVGFPEMDGFSPILREAVVRRTGHAPLPEPLELPEDSLWNRGFDGRRVAIKARLVSFENDRADQVLEMQAGSRRFLCRLDPRHGKLGWIVPESTLEVTGVYAAQGNMAVSDRRMDSFELLLNSPEDVNILAKPPWWTLRHALTILGAMVPIVLAAVIWIALLRRQVEKRTHQLALEIQRHEQTERQRVIEGERSRIARDLHDALGAALTQIRFLSIRGSRAPHISEKGRAQMQQISEKSLEMVSTLDEIVWAVNPANDSLDHLATYFCHIAEEFFGSTSIRCRLDVEDHLPQASLTSEVRHNLFLAVRETMNNIARHSQASEVWFRIRWHEEALQITLEDNGRGFITPPPTGGDGLGNLRHRIEKIGGHFAYETRLGSGTLFLFRLPLKPELKPAPSI